jgi:hypothetical protein
MRSGPDQRPGKQFHRNRPSQPNSGTSRHSQAFDSHGPGDRTRGTAPQIYERYLTLAREAARTDDRVAAEGYYQHAEHYFRVGNATRDGNSAAASQPIDQATVETRPAPTARSESEEPVISAPQA